MNDTGVNFTECRRKPDSTKHILILEDDHCIGSVFSQVLNALGYRVSMAASIKEAIASCCRKMPDAVILDMVLSDGTAGDLFDFFSKNNIPTIVTSILNRDIVCRMLGTRNFLFIQKPFEISYIADTVLSLDKSGCPVTAACPAAEGNGSFPATIRGYVGVWGRLVRGLKKLQIAKVPAT